MRHVTREIAHRQQIALARDDDLVVVLRERIRAELHRRLHQAGNLALQAHQLLLHAGTHLFDGHAGVVRIQKVGRLHQLALGEIDFGQQDAVLHIPLGRDNDHQEAPLREAQKFDVPKHRRALGRHDHTDKVRQVREQLRGVRNDPLRLIGCERGGLKVFALDRHHGVDKQAVAPGRGHAAGRGVGAGDQAQVFEVGHHVADGRRREVQTRRFGQGARTHRLAVRNVAFDQRLEQ